MGPRLLRHRAARGGLVPARLGQRMGATPCVHFELWGAISTEIPVVIEPIADVTISHDTPLDTFTDPFEMQCAP